MTDESVFRHWVSRYHQQQQIDKERREKYLGEHKSAIIAWCDELSRHGTLKFKWNGGDGKSNCSLFLERPSEERLVSGESGHTSENYVALLENLLYDRLDYGSWTGDFSAAGEVVYDPVRKVFRGTDEYSDYHQLEFPCGAVLRVPATLPFASVRIAYDSGTDRVNVEFFLQNGFYSPQYALVALENEKQLFKAFQQTEANARKIHGNNLGNCYEESQVDRNDLTLEGDELILTLEEIVYDVRQVSERDIYIDLNNPSITEDPKTR